MSRRDLTVAEASGVLVVQGELDAATAPALDEVLERAESSVSLDLDTVTFIDSTGVSVLVRHHQRLVASGSRVSIVHASANVRRLLELTGLTELLAERDERTSPGPVGEVPLAG